MHMQSISPLYMEAVYRIEIAATLYSNLSAKSQLCHCLVVRSLAYYLTLPRDFFFIAKQKNKIYEILMARSELKRIF